MPTRGEKKKKMTLTTHCWLLARCCCLRQRLPKNGNQRICSVVGAPIFRWWWHTNYWADNVVSVKLQMWPRFMAVCNFKDITMKGSRRRRQILSQGTSCSVSHHIVGWMGGGGLYHRRQVTSQVPSPSVNQDDEGEDMTPGYQVHDPVGIGMTCSDVASTACFAKVKV